MGNEPQKRRRKARHQFVPANPDQELYTVDQFCDAERAFKPGGIRWEIFNKSEELEKSGALVRVGKRVLLNRKKYLARLMPVGTA